MKSVIFLVVSAVLCLFTPGCRFFSQSPASNGSASHGVTAPASSKPVRGRLPQITSRIENGFEDVIFGVQKVDTLPFGDTAIVVAGMYGKTRVGFKILVKKTTKPLKTKGNAAGLKFDRGKIHLLSTGAESDRFVSILKSLYSRRFASAQIRADTPFTCIVLDGDPAKIQTQPIRYKLLYADDANAPRADYAELYLRINLMKGDVRLAEKDTVYREAIVRALIQPY